MAAATLFAGFYFRQRLTAVSVPLAIMTLSDPFLGGYAKPLMAAVYGSLLIPIAWRSVLRADLSPTRVGLAAVVSSLTFYLLSNAAVWYAWCPHTLEGMARCYALALPFFGNTLASDLLFSAGFFGLYALATHGSKATSHALAPSAA